MNYKIIKSKFKDSIDIFAHFILLMLLSQIVFRVFEFIKTDTTNLDFSFYNILLSFLSDFLFTFSFSARLYPVFLLLFLINKKAAEILNTIILTVSIFAGVGFLLYFIDMHYPLDKVFFSYSLDELLLIAQTSGNINPLSIFASVLLIIFIVVLVRIFNKYKFFGSVSALMLVFMILSLISDKFLGEKLKENYSEKEYYTLINKTDYFINDAFNFLFSEKQTNIEKVSDEIIKTFQSFYPNRNFINKEYPMLHTTSNDAVLSNFFNKSTKKPNIVIVIVESLSRCYSGTNAWAGSYTPFLDSLTQYSLYWDNFTSTSERTVGVLPGILGSLPSANEGFTVMGGKMPLHLTLMSILKKNGYNTEFYYGGLPSFDNTNVFLSRQGVDKLESGDYYKKEGRVYWGLNDSITFAKSLLYRAEQKNEKPFLSVYLTLSTHGPFDYPEQAELEDFILNKWSKKLNKQQKEYLKKNYSRLASYYYTDRQIRNLFYGLKALKQMDNTIFIVTGDHGRSDVCSDNPVQRYHVPLLIYSPLLKTHKHFKAVNTHYNVTPSLLAFLKKDYLLQTPDNVYWMGRDFDTSAIVKSKIPVPIMQINRSVQEVLYNDYFLSKGKLYHIENNLQMKLVNNDTIQQKMQKWLNAYLQINNYVCNNNYLMPEKEYSKWGILYKIKDKKNKKRILIDSTTTYTRIWKEDFKNTGSNYRVTLDFTLMPNTIDHKKYPQFVLEVRDAENKKVFYNSIYWMRKEKEFESNKKNHFSLSIETYIPPDLSSEECELKAYLWNKNNVRLELKDIEIKVFKQVINKKK